MLRFIGIQSGHQNIGSNCDLALRPSTGAPGEVTFTVKVRDRLGQILNSKKNTDGTKAFTVQLDDANANCDSNTTSKNFDFYLAIHYEADIHNKGGGFMTAPDPSVDVVNSISQKIVTALKSEYFKNTGIEEHEEWISNNMTFYYMWRSLTAPTPCGIIECGVGQNAHDKVILADTDRVANAIARGICKAFNVPFDIPTPPAPTPDPIDYQTLYKAEVKKTTKLTTDITTANDRIKKIKDSVASA